MGTRYEDQPPEHWAGPESLDPTPTWKQFMVVGLLGLAALAIIAVVAALALAPMFVTPPAVVPGGRVILARSDVSTPEGRPIRIGAPLIDEEDAFWVYSIRDGFVPGDVEIVAVSASWTEPVSGQACEVIPQGPALSWRTAGDCDATFGQRGEPLQAPRGLDRYLVSVEGDRVIVNVSREIRGFGATPQPLVSPLATPVPTATR